jgi:hypothetical protein
MNSSPDSPNPAPGARAGSSFRNWLSLTGFVVIAASLFAFILLFVLDAMTRTNNPYVGILTYLVAPAFLLFGGVLTVLGAWLRRRQVAKAAGTCPAIKIDMSRPRDRKMLGIFGGASFVFMLITASLIYQSYHFTESVQFCGQACHTVMEPELTTYLHSPHARVACTECHIGSGATWFVRSKLSGSYQVYATLANKYPRPIPTPVKNLRPAQETCEQCHWPQKFTGNLDRTYNYFLTDEENTPYTVRLLMKVGGGNPAYGPVGGIHWHMNVANKIEYIATDPARQKIPWVRMTDPQGVVTEFRTPDFTDDISKYPIRTMDCMDCHNRPAHQFQTPNDAVNQAIALNKLDRFMPSIKSNAVYVLTQDYATRTEALQNIATTLSAAYPDDSRARSAISAVQQIYSINFFPEMKADWRVYPDNIGHKDWLGCFRCHSGDHKSVDGKQSIKFNDCNACHIILAQGSGAELDMLNPHGQEFKHPEEDYDTAFRCSDCHDGGL